MKKFFLLLVPFTVFAEWGSSDSSLLSNIEGNTVSIKNSVSTSTGHLSTIKENSTYIRNWLSGGSASYYINSYVLGSTLTSNPSVSVSTIGYYSDSSISGLMGLLNSSFNTINNNNVNSQKVLARFLYSIYEQSVSQKEYIQDLVNVNTSISNLVSSIIEDNTLYRNAYTNLFSYSFANLTNDTFQIINLLRSDTNIAFQCKTALEFSTNVLGRIEKINSLGFDNTTNSIVNFARQVQDQYADYTNYLKTTVFKLPQRTTQNNHYYFSAGSTLSSTQPTADSSFSYNNMILSPKYTLTELLDSILMANCRLLGAVTRNQVQNIKNLQDIRRILTSWSNNVHVVVDSMPEINIDIPSNSLDRTYDQSSVIHSEIGYLWDPTVTNAITQGSELVAPYHNSVPLSGDFFQDVVNLLEGQIQQNNSANITLYTMLSLLQGTNATLDQVQHEVDDTISDTQSSVSSALSSFTAPSNISALPDSYDLGEALDLFQDVELPSYVHLDASSVVQNYSFFANHIDGSNLYWVIDIRPAFWCFRLMRAISIVLLITIFIQFYFWLAYYFVKFIWFIGIVFTSKQSGS